MKTDKELIQIAIQAGDYWEVIYRARRVLQIDHDNQEARNALLGLRGGDLRYKNDKGLHEVHPLFGTCDGITIKEVVTEADLVEREADSDICELDDRTDSIFVILKGEVAVYIPDRSGTLIRLQNSFGKGQIFGELAHVLHRARSATVRTTKKCSLLALRPALIQSLQRRRHVGQSLTAAWRSFILPRVLSVLCQHVSYLGPPGGPGPLKGVAAAAERLSEDTVIHEFNWVNTRDRNIRGTGRRFRRGGLYLLSGGKLTNEHNNNHVLDGDSFPIIGADFGNDFVHNFRHLALKGGDEAKILFISQEVLSRLGAEVFQGIIEGAMRDALRVFHYDIFLSYSSKDYGEALRWEQDLVKSGLRVYLDTKTHNDHFHDRVFSAILDSVMFVPLLSTHTRSQNCWVAKEVRIRQHIYPPPDGNVTPVLLAGGIPDGFADGYTSIDGTNRRRAVADVVRAARRARAGTGSLLHSRNRVLFEEIAKVASTSVPELHV